jgi:hypothetical protein
MYSFAERNGPLDSAAVSVESRRPGVLSAEGTAIFRLPADVPAWWLARLMAPPPPLEAVLRKAASADLPRVLARSSRSRPAGSVRYDVSRLQMSASREKTARARRWS